MRKEDMLKKVRLYKVVSKSGRACNGGDYKYDLPKNGKPGAWSTPIPHNTLVRCSKGYHITDANSLPNWYEPGRDRKVYLVEMKAPLKCDLFYENKVVCSSIRLIKRVTITRAFDKLWDELNGDSCTEDCPEFYVRDDRRLDKLLVGSAKR